MTSPISVGSTANISAIGNTETVDLQTLMLSVMAEKTQLLDEKIRGQVGMIQAKNETLKQLNSFINEAQVSMNTATGLDQSNQLKTSDDGKNLTITVGDGDYTITVPKDNTDQSWTITDKNGNTTKIWGDPHVNEDADGSRIDWDFKEQSTFMLDDGTKITVDTAPWGNGMTVSSGLTITRGDEVVQVTGIDTNNVKLENDAETGGRTIDATTNDGDIFKMGSGDASTWYNESGGRITTDQAMTTEKINEVTVETNDVELSEEFKAFLQANPDIAYTDSDGDGKLTTTEYKSLISSMESFRDSLTSSSQLEMTMMQSDMNKYNQTFEALSNFISKYNQSLGTITGNLR